MKKSANNETPIDRVLGLLENVRASGNGWTALCPAHGDRNNSLGVAEGDDGRVLVKCFAGCNTQDIVEMLGLEMQDLFPSKKDSQSARGGGLTLSEYAQTKKIPIEFLQGIGLGEISLQGKTVVRMPYIDAAGSVVSVRMRLSMKGEPRFVWKRGSKASPYGLWRLSGYSGKYVCLVEGESDCHTLWLNRFPALGLPGAATWQESWASDLDRFERIYLVLEPDLGGEAVKRWLAQSKIRDRALLITLDGVKDPSDLYLADPENFTSAWKAAMKAAVPWQEIEDGDRKARRKAAWAKCKDLARSPDILALVVRALRQLGVVGERRAAVLVYLAVTSRFLSRPVSLVLAAQSSAGKSFLVQKILEFFPEDAFYALTAMSERALAYSEEPLAHRMLVIYEGAALESEFANYILRSLLSEGHLRYVTVEKTAEGLCARLIERPGPTGLLLTTTAVKLHPENTTRLFSVPVTDTPAQTRRVMRAIASAHNGDGSRQDLSMELDPWRAFQTWLAYKNNTVVIPYAGALAELIPPVAVRLRRDFTAILTLIESHAILHRANRELDEHARIVATLEDYKAIHELVNDLISDGVEQTVPETIRQTVEAVGRACSDNAANEERARGDKDDPNAATVLQVAKALQIDRSSASRRVKQALTRGYLKNVETKRGRPHRLVTGDPLPEECGVMPTPEEVLKQWKAMR
jgi:hypothetical protein